MDESGCIIPLTRVLLSNQELAVQPQSGSLAFDLILIFILILINGFFAGSEMAIVTQNDNRIRKMADEGSSAAKKLMHVVENKSQMMATIQVSITFAGFLSSAFAADKIASRVYLAVDPSFQSPWLQTLFVVLITILVSYFSLVLGELVPKRLAMRNPEQMSLKVVSVLLFFDIIFRPFTKLLNWSTNGVLRLFGIDPKETQDTITEDEIRILAEAGVDTGDLPAEDAFLIDNIFAFDDKDVGEIMTPRLSIAAISVDSTYDEAVNFAANAHFSRFPVYDEDLDNIVGTLFLKDLMRVPAEERGDDFDLHKIMRNPYFVPEGKQIDILFREMKSKHISMAIVVDEYGGTEGLITMEDLLEEIVGEIEDEYDPPKNDVVENPDGSFILSGLLTPQEAGRYVEALEDLEEDDNYDTIAGFVLSLLGRIPADGEQPSVIFENLRFTVLAMDDRRIDQILLEILPEDELPEDESGYNNGSNGHINNGGKTDVR
ncbi:MAG: hemolysin family protein [Eubacteriales bacterium]|nr:hemolysin family protein [Eubacteriales bacterium]MDD4540551.1 hemolysin family protein [Eubacteriales bacterium]